MKNPPIIIIGAGRSGTNILRDSICSIHGFETWPCDEINYIWRHKNVKHTTDRFQSKEAFPEVKKYIQNQFKSLEKNSNAEYVVEKTCANSLKVPFINEIFPNAKYIFLVRDGRDVTSSAKQRWKAPLELKYIWKKVKYVPIIDVPYYGFRYLVNRLKKIFSKEKRLAFWGPLYPSMMDDLKKYSLIEVCAKQWVECVQTAYNDLKEIDPIRVHILKYETFVNSPVQEMKKVLDFLNTNVSNVEIQNSVNKVSPKSINNHKKYLTQNELDKVEQIVFPVMENIYNNLD